MVSDNEPSLLAHFIFNFSLDIYTNLNWTEVKQNL
ncbi:uncharacterized protein METZ01_LOCUS219391 [marine metagenome]|uniref:Uncharacterized protein n=1 Tax=marine metagenome TaxID=408172 RepID=A0A382FWE5_9ZZZZ